MDKQLEFLQTKLKAEIAAAATGRPLKKIKKVYYGDPILIPSSSLPAIIITPGQQQVTARGTRYDNHSETINIKYVYNIKDFMGKANVDKVAFVEEWVKLFSETETGVNKFKSDSIAGILRENNTLGGTAQWSGEFSINYEFTNLRDFIAFEATMSINILALGDR